MVPSELLAVGGFAAVILFAWSPLLGIERIRALFSWPTDWVVVNYVAVGVAFVVVQVLSYVAVVLLAAGTGSVSGGEAGAIVGGVAAANVVLPGGCALGAVRLLPRRGVWTPDGGGLSGRIALGIGVVWYAAVSTVTVLVVGLVVMFANLPT
jgi:hypothetical protein